MGNSEIKIFSSKILTIFGNHKVLGPPAGPAFPKGLASWGAARKMTKCWSRPPHQQGRRLCCCQHFVIKITKCWGYYYTPPAPCRFLQGGRPVDEKRQSAGGVDSTPSRGSVVVYILNGSGATQISFASLLEKHHQRKKRWLVERNRWGPQRPDF